MAGSDDTITIWLSGEKIHAKNVYRGAQMDQDRVAARLGRGENEVLVKACQGSGGRQFCLRVADELGVSVEGSRYETGR